MHPARRPARCACGLQRPTITDYVTLRALAVTVRRPHCRGDSRAKGVHVDYDRMVGSFRGRWTGGAGGGRDLRAFSALSASLFKPESLLKLAQRIRHNPVIRYIHEYHRPVAPDLSRIGLRWTPTLRPDDPLALRR